MGSNPADLGPQGEETAAAEPNPYQASETTKYIKDVTHVCAECEHGACAQSQ